MSIPYDLPRCMSNTQELDDSRDVSGPSCEATSRCKRSIASPRISFRRAAIPLVALAALLASAVLPPAGQETATVAPAPVTYKVRSNLAASIDEVTASDAVVGEVGLALAQPQAAPSASVIGSIANVRNGPSTGYGIIGTVTYGTQLQALAQNSGWYKVRTPYGTVGWIAGWLVNISPAVANSLPFEAVGQASGTSPSVSSGDVAQIALRYVGYPYAYGAAGPYAFDCSGLTQFVYSQVGVYLPRMASMQFSWAYGQIIGSMSELQPGDLVFFAGTYAAPGITHTAVYVGNGRMVSAGTPWTGVTIEYIYAPYWTSKWVGGLRPYR